MMLQLTNQYNGGKALILSCRHVVAIQPDETGGSEILTSTGDWLHVKESPDVIGQMNAWVRHD